VLRFPGVNNGGSATLDNDLLDLVLGFESFELSVEE